MEAIQVAVGAVADRKQGNIRGILVQMNQVHPPFLGRAVAGASPARNPTLFAPALSGGSRAHGGHMVCHCLRKQKGENVTAKLEEPETERREGESKGERRVAPGPRRQGCQGARAGYAGTVNSEASSLADWTPEQVALGQRWARVWMEAGPALEQVRRQELRRLDPERAIALLCGPADYHVPPRSAKATSGLVEQQRWFMKSAGRA